MKFFDLVVLYYLDLNKIQLIKDIDRTSVIVLWSFYGAELYSLPGVKYEMLICMVAEDMDVNGCINMEFIKNNDEYFLIDVNPRFSAGIGFSELVGYDFVRSHINCFIGKDILPTITYQNVIAEKKMIEVINVAVD